jgi:bacterioferritin-associated ferredoxin
MFSDSFDPCNTCPGRIICRCLNVTEEDVVTALAIHGAETVKEIRGLTGAGDGCTACHRRLELLLVENGYSSSSASPICSVK